MSARIFDQARNWLLDPQAVKEAITLLGVTIREQWNPDIIIGIARGGVEPANMLANDLNIPVYYIRARHNSSDNIRSTPLPKVYINHFDVAAVPAGRRILLVDDICGTGETLLSVTDSLRASRQVDVLKTVTLCCNAGSQISPDLFVWTVRDWVIFPWEKAPKSLYTERLGLPDDADTRNRFLVTHAHTNAKSLQAV